MTSCFCKTAACMECELKECISSGCNEYITKPVDIDLLYQTLIRYVKD